MIPQKDGDGNVILDQEGKVVLQPVECALCKKHKAILSTQDPSLRGIKKEDLTPAQEITFKKNKDIFMDAMQWEAKKFYIIRGIDKGNQKHGVKYWRFKHNFKHQGVFDKLLPILGDYIDNYQVDFTDPERGTDLSITVTDGQFNNITYKQVSAITFKGPSKLHEDELVVREWLADVTTWRDVFLPRKAPNVEPPEYLEMLATGNDPYWDDSDPQNKKWVFPGRPDLAEKANTRNDNLDADENKNFAQASDVVNDGVNINNVTEKHVGQFVDTGTDVGQEVKTSAPAQPVAEPQAEVPTQPAAVDMPDGNDKMDEGDGGFDDLPF